MNEAFFFRKEKIFNKKETKNEENIWGKQK